MGEYGWCRVPVGLDAQRWVTRSGCRSVLVVVHTVTGGQRLVEVVAPLARDPRVQVMFTVGPDVFGNGVPGLLHRLGVVVVPWLQAINQRFDLAVAAAYGGIAELHAPLVVLSHGAGHNKLTSRRLAGGVPVVREVYGLAGQSLVRDGRVIPAAIGLAHRADRVLLERSCPPAALVAHVLGDPCFDTIRASISFRDRYRDALGLAAGEELVVLASTWGHRALFNRVHRLVSGWLAHGARRGTRIALMLHPNVWFGHGVWQVRAWLHAWVREGLIVIGPDVDWRAVLVAADWVIGDHGSTTLYGAAAGARVLTCAQPGEVAAGSPMAELLAAAPRFVMGRPLGRQLDKHRAIDRGVYRPAIERITSRPGGFATAAQRLFFHQLGLRSPASVPRAEPAPPPAAAA